MAKDMSKLAAELKKCGETLVSIAEVLAAAQNESTQEPKLEESVKRYSLEDVRAVLAKKAASGFQDEVKELLGKFNAKKLSDINPDDYGNLLKEAEAIGNAG